MAGQGCAKVEGNRIHCADGEVYEGDNLEYVGFATGEKRARLYQNAKGVFVPTTYVEPFGAVAIEGQFAGTPAITTDWGAFPETVEHGKSGFRCHTLNEFVWAAKHVGDLDPQYIHARAVRLYAMDNVRWCYETYFKQLGDLWGAGWYAQHPQPDERWLRGHCEELIV
jgi:glycosyltransferase involved in cell wall biosynthesis